LREIAGPTITFLNKANDNRVSDADMPAQLSGAEAFLFASFDDFGIAPVEAMAAGTPVIAYKAGGALDYVVPGETGEFFDEQTADSLVGTLKDFDGAQYNHQAIAKHAAGYSAEHFRRAIRDFLQKIL
jgi:glycosyltransferase involved in cell wall biosynthesis